MEENELIIEIIQRLTKLERTVDNGIKKELVAIVSKLERIIETLQKHQAELSSLKATQKIQWYLLGGIFLAIVSLFLKK